MDLVTLLAEAAAHESDTDSTVFYIVGGLTALFAVLVGIAGIRRPEWNDSQARAVMVVGTILVVATVASAIIVT